MSPKRVMMDFYSNVFCHSFQKKCTLFSLIFWLKSPIPVHPILWFSKKKPNVTSFSGWLWRQTQVKWPKCKYWGLWLKRIRVLLRLRISHSSLRQLDVIKWEFDRPLETSITCLLLLVRCRPCSAPRSQFTVQLLNITKIRSRVMFPMH